MNNMHERLTELYEELFRAHRKLATETGDEYFDQKSSPLGSRLHCRLVRCGALPGYRAGRRVLVRRADLNAYLERQRIAPRKAQEAADEFDTLLAEFGGRKRVA